METIIISTIVVLGTTLIFSIGNMIRGNAEYFLESKGMVGLQLGFILALMSHLLDLYPNYRYDLGTFLIFFLGFWITHVVGFRGGYGAYTGHDHSMHEDTFYPAAWVANAIQEEVDTPADARRWSVIWVSARYTILWSIVFAVAAYCLSAVWLLAIPFLPLLGLTYGAPRYVGKFKHKEYIIYKKFTFNRHRLAEGLTGAMLGLIIGLAQVLIYITN